MRVAVISDIHGNGVALDAVIADVAHNPVDRWICLGDAIQGGLQPLEVAERLDELDCPVILGNADAFVLSPYGPEAEIESHVRVATWGREALGSRGIELVGSYPPTYEIELGDAGTMLCFHGTPDSFEAVIAPDTPADVLRKELGGRGARVLCGGHIHRQWTVSLDDWTFFNPGSAGLAYNFHLPPDEVYIYPFAEYAIVSVDGAAPRIEFCQVPYDIHELDRVARTSDHPYAASQAIRYRPRT